MRRKTRALLLTALFAFAVLGTGAAALAAETGVGQGSTETPTTETPSSGTPSTETSSSETASTEATVTPAPAEPVWPAFTEPSAKRGLQTESGYQVYYGTNGYLKTGWKKIRKSVYYFRPEAVDGPRGSAVTGFQSIGAHTYYFDSKGVLKTGWQTIGGKRYYFAPSGALGMLGRMYTGLNKIDKKRYYFNENGRMKTGWVTYKNKKYFFTKGKKSKTYGVAYTGWHTISGARYYFKATGVMKKNGWVDKKYYVGTDGKMLKSCVTPDGYFVDAKGLKGKLANGFVKIGKKTYYYQKGKKAVGLRKIKGKRYYFNADGVRKNKGMITVGAYKYYIKNGVVQTGWVTYNGKRYYFQKNGRMAVNTTVDGIKLGTDGTTDVSVLILSGHGQGDSGATATYGSTSYREDNLTREFAKLIYQQFSTVSPGVNVTLYDQNYDCYQVLSGKKSGPKPDFKMYDYVLEVHFNATVASGKDASGDGSYKGTGMYVNSAKKDTTIDKKIVAAVAKAGGLPIWGRGTGIFPSSTLFNARTLQAMGVSYGLLETVFIDDRDDMNAYNKNKNAMAKAVAQVIGDYFGVGYGG